MLQQRKKKQQKINKVSFSNNWEMMLRLVAMIISKKMMIHPTIAKRRKK